MSFVLQLAVVLVSALTYASCFPPSPHPALAWVALVPFLVVLRRVTLRRGLVLSWLWTVAMAYTVNDWFPRAVSGYFGQPAAVGIALFLGVSTFTAGVEYMAFAALYQRTARLDPVVAPFLAGAAWVTADLGRLYFLGGDPWALFGYAQVSVPLLVQIADLAGVHGVTFVVVAVNAALAEVWIAGRSGRLRSRAAAGLGLACLSVAFVVAYGAYRLRAGETSSGDGLPVGIVQPNLPLGSQWKREYYGRNLDAYLRLTGDLLGAGRTRLVVWPENAMTFFLPDEPAYRHAIARVLGPSGGELLAGGPRATLGPPEAYWNSAYLVAPDGEIRGRYDKRWLLPFAEYFPLGYFDFLRRAFGRIREFTPGDETPLLDATSARLGVIICNEGFFPEPAADRVRRGATVLVNLANDSWLGDAKYSEPAFDMVVLRAVEQRRWIIRASTSGPSALIDPFGRVVQRSALFSAATIAGIVEARDTRTIYSRIGDLFAWSCVVAALAAWLVARRGSKGNAREEVRDGHPARPAAA